MEPYNYKATPTKAENMARIEKALKDLFAVEQQLGGTKAEFCARLNQVGLAADLRSLDNWRLGEWDRKPPGKSRTRRRSRPRAVTVLGVEEAVKRLRHQLTGNGSV